MLHTTTAEEDLHILKACSSTSKLSILTLSVSRWGSKRGLQTNPSRDEMRWSIICSWLRVVSNNASASVLKQQDGAGLSTFRTHTHVPLDLCRDSRMHMGIPHRARGPRLE